LSRELPGTGSKTRRPGRIRHTADLDCCPPPVGAGLPRELPGTGSETRRPGRVRYTALAGFAGASHQIVGKPDSHALRAEAM
jgi:hypothetical protein